MFIIIISTHLAHTGNNYVMICFLRPWTLTLVKGMNFIEDIEKYLNDIIWLRFVQNAQHLAYSATFSQQIESVVNKKYCHMQTKIFLRSNFTYQCILHKIDQNFLLLFFFMQLQCFVWTFRHTGQSNIIYWM